MPYEMREGDGSLFKNDKKESDRQPDYKGSILVGGQEYWVSAWIKRRDGKDPFMSLSAKPKDGQREAPARTVDVPDDIPF